MTDAVPEADALEQRQPLLDGDAPSRFPRSTSRSRGGRPGAGHAGAVRRGRRAALTRRRRGPPPCRGRCSATGPRPATSWPASSATTRRDDVLVLALPAGGVPVAARVAAALGRRWTCSSCASSASPATRSWPWGRSPPAGSRWSTSRWSAGSGWARPTCAGWPRRGPRAGRRERSYREGRAPPELAGRVVILVDDGLATGSTMRAAVAAARRLGPARVVVAVPTAPASTCQRLREEADEVVCATTPGRSGPSATPTARSPRPPTRRSAPSSVRLGHRPGAGGPDPGPRARRAGGGPNLNRSS
jgi:hypothetical protein